MDAEVDGNLLSNGQNLSEHFVLENLSHDLDSHTSELQKLPTKPGDPIIPGTPESKQENGEYANDFASPISCVPKAHSLSSQKDVISSNGDSPRTPKDSVFDPFAPGPEKLLLAPLCPKYTSDSRNSVTRVLNFSFEGHRDHDVNADNVADEDMVETLCGMLLRVIVSKHREEVLAGISNPFFESDGDMVTPTCAPLLSGIAESCPGAPKKTARQIVNIDKGLCKKLEF